MNMIELTRPAFNAPAGLPIFINAAGVVAFWRVSPPYPRDAYTIIEMDNGKHFEVAEKPDVVASKLGAIGKHGGQNVPE